MKTILYSLLFLLGLCGSVHASVKSLKNEKQQLLFVENKGQVKDQCGKQRNDVSYSMKAGAGLTIFAQKGGLIYQFSEQSGKDSITHFYRVEVELTGANKDAKIVAEVPQEYTERHILRTDGKKQVVCHSFSRITYQGIYPGIDWVLYNNGGKLKHEFIVHENGNAGSIKINYKGATAVNTGTNGDLHISTPLGTITEAAPSTFYNGREVASNYMVSPNSVGYYTSGFTNNLIIDPYVSWGTFLGANAHDWCNDIITDASEKLYITGSTYSNSTIATTGAYDTSFHAPNTCFLEKFDTLGNRIWGTYVIAGEGFSLDADNFGHIYLAGVAFYSPMPSSAYLGCFDAAGNLSWDTTVYDSYNCFGKGVASDRFGNVYLFEHVSDHVYVVDRPLVYKFDSGGNYNWSVRPIAHTYSSDRTFASAIATDTAGNVFISGFTTNPAGITTSGAYQTVANYSFEPYIMKLDSSGSKIWATYYSPSFPASGGSADPNDIKVDNSGNVYISISSPSSGSSRVGFVAKLNSTGSSVLWRDSMLITGCFSLSLDRNTNVYVAGKASSTSYDVMVRVYNSSGAPLDAWAYHSMSQIICFNGITPGRNGEFYVCGQIYDTSSWVAAGAHQPTFGGVSDGLILRFSPCISTTVAAITGASSVCVNHNTPFADATAGGTWSSSDPSIATVDATSGLVTGVATGTATITYAIPSPCGPAEANKVISVVPEAIACGVSVTNVEASEMVFNISPNPSNGEITMFYSNGGNDPANIVLSNILGQTLNELALTNGRAKTLQLDAPPGIYFVTLTSAGVKMTQKLVIQ
ncbi:MAG: T9SS type A sorting domain-containing protein [Taibaiella sp.]|nr:T9SS type A sorting domain-containing protein [Taibaiella sp.]